MYFAHFHCFADAKGILTIVCNRFSRYCYLNIIQYCIFFYKTYGDAIKNAEMYSATKKMYFLKKEN